MIGIWYLQTTGLNEATSKNESKIKGEFQRAQNIQRQKPADLPDEGGLLHPNRITKEGMQSELEETVDSIIAAWKLRVDAQKKLLVFPEVIDNEQFGEIFAKYNPPETFPVKYADIGTIGGLLSLYRDKIPQHMINICGKDGVRTNWLDDPANYDQTEEGSRRRGRSEYGDGMEDEPVFEVTSEDAARFAVLWSDVNQELWRDKLTKFQGRDDHDKESLDPTPLQAYMLQQDLWVLEAMFNVIRSLNGDSNSTDTSAIKQIDHIAIGREGTPRLGELHAVDARFAPKVETTDETIASSDPYGYGDDGPGGQSDYELDFSEEEPIVDIDGYGTGGPGAEEEESTKGMPPFHNMYVDTKFEPISSEEVLKVVEGKELSENNLELLIAKRLPVRIGLKMDERKIPDFMAACVNSPFSFEIQQVRINRHKAGGELIELGTGETSIDLYNGDASATSVFDDVSQVETRVNYDVNVEFFGIIKIYNPVRADLIRKAAGLQPENPTAGGNVDPSDSASVQDDYSGFRIAG